MKKPRQRNTRKKAKGFNTKIKGDILEEITAGFHNQPGIIVERKVYLPTKDEGRKREIDVLLSAYLAGYPIRIAIECKNENQKVGTEKIDSFVGKLKDVGIPREHGIYVSSRGYTKDAKLRAKEAGIRTLYLDGLTKEGLRKNVEDALQSIIYLLARIESISVMSNNPRLNNSGDLELLYNEEGKFMGMLSNIIWNMWFTGKIPDSIESHVVMIDLPSSWHMVLNGQTEIPQNIIANVQVIGLVFSITGKVEKYRLIDAINNKLEKQNINMSFDLPKMLRSYKPIFTESELKNYIDGQKKGNMIISRIRLPRILNGPVYWPPSQRVLEHITHLMQEYQAGRIPDPRPFSFEDIEGTDLNTVYEPIVQSWFDIDSK